MARLRWGLKRWQWAVVVAFSVVNTAISLEGPLSVIDLAGMGISIAVGYVAARVFVGAYRYANYRWIQDGYVHHAKFNRERKYFNLILIVGVISAGTLAFAMVAPHLSSSDLDGGDFDGDGIPNAAENKSEVNGAPLPDADSHQKDLYVTLLYSNNSERLTEMEKQQLQSIWGSMNVSNPTGEPGIDLHIVEERRAQKQFEKQWSGDYNEKGGITDVYEDTINEGCGVYHLVIMGELSNSKEADVNGWGDGPGYATYVNHERQSYESTEYGLRVQTITHELLHNIVGEIDGEHAPNDPLHSREGWLSTVQQADELPENEALDPVVARQLSTDGFKGSKYYRSEVC